MTSSLANESCTPCDGNTPPLSADQVQSLLRDLPGWTLTDTGRAIARRITVKGFLRAVELANLAAWVGNSQGHHPDITFGYGYCQIVYATHAIGGLSRNDFICAARTDSLVP